MTVESLSAPHGDSDAEIVELDASFSDWEGLLRLVLSAFASMQGVIDPPSSALRLTPASLAEKAAAERVFAIFDGTRPVACIFCDLRGEALYVGKLAVDPERQGIGLGSALLARAETEARRLGCTCLELQTRIELTGNRRFFESQGFAVAFEGRHEGYDRTTWLWLRKELPPEPMIRP